MKKYLCLLILMLALVFGGQAQAVDGDYVEEGKPLNWDGISLSSTASGTLTLLGGGDGTDEALILNLNTANTALLTSTTGVLSFNFGTIDLITDVIDLTGITDGRVPYISASGSTNSPIQTDGTNVGIGTSPSQLFHVKGANPIIWLEDTDNFEATASRTMQGIQLSSANSTSYPYFGTGIKFMSTDSSFTTENPKFLAGIFPRTASYYPDDTYSGMRIAFLTSPLTAGATNVPIVRGEFDENGTFRVYMDALLDDGILIDGYTNDMTSTAYTESAMINMRRDYNVSAVDSAYGIYNELEFDNTAAAPSIQTNWVPYYGILDNNGALVHSHAWPSFTYLRGAEFWIRDDGTYDTAVDQQLLVSEQGLLVSVYDHPVFSDSSGASPANSLSVYGLKVDIIDTPTLASGSLARQTDGIYIDVESNAAGSSVARGIIIASVTGGDTNWGIVDVSGADWALDQDSQKIYFGENVDSYIEFDGDSFNIISDAVTATDDIYLNEFIVDQDGNISTSTITLTGTGTLNGLDAVDATTEATIESAIDTLANLTSIQGQTISLLGSLTVESASWLNQDLTSDASPTFVTTKLSGLTDGYLPYHVADATGLANSPLFTNGIQVSLGGTDVTAPFVIYGANTSNETLAGFKLKLGTSTDSTRLQQYYGGISYFSQNLYRNYADGKWYLDKTTDDAMGFLFNSNSAITPTGISFITIPATTGDVTSYIINPRVFITKNGAVGIGDTTPDYLLDVAGNIGMDGDAYILGDDLFMTTNTLGAVLVGDGTNYNPVVMSGDASIAADGTVTVTDDSHAHTTTTISGLDISADTNLTAGDALTLTDDDIDFDGGASPGGELGGTWASPTVDDGIHDDEYVELGDNFVGDVTGPYSATVVGNDSHTHGAGTITEADPLVDSEAEIEAITGAKFGASKAVTAGYIWVADGTDFESVIVSGDISIASGGAVTVADDSHAHIYSNIDATTIANWNGLISDADIQPLEATLTDIADGTIAEDLVNTANPWADNEVADNITAGNAATVTTNANLTGDVTSVGNATDITESVLGVGGTDTLFPADPDADRFLMWDDDPGALIWSAAAGESTTVSDTTTIDLTLTGVDITADGLYTAGDDLTLTGVDFDVDSTVTRDTEWDTEGEVQTVWGSVNILLETEIDASSELAALMDDETGTGALVFANTPTLVTPEIGVATGTKLTLTENNPGGAAGMSFRNSGGTDPGTLTRMAVGMDISETTYGLLFQYEHSTNEALIYNRKATTGFLTIATTGGAMTMDNSGNLIILGTTPVATYELTVNNDIYAVGDVSALTFTDRASPIPEGRDLTVLEDIKAIQIVGIEDKKTLPDYIQSNHEANVYEDVELTAIFQKDAFETVMVEQDKIIPAEYEMVFDKKTQGYVKTVKEPEHKIVKETIEEFKGYTFENGQAVPKYETKTIYEIEFVPKVQLRKDVYGDPDTGLTYQKAGEGEVKKTDGKIIQTVKTGTKIEEGTNLGMAVSMLIVAVQEQQKRIEALQVEIEALKAR